MGEDVLKVANSLPMWLLCGMLVAIVLVQATMFIRLCRKEAGYLNYPQQKLNTAIKNGMTTAIGPALAGIVIMIGMMAIVGSPITWQRLSVIGSAQSELMVADMAATAMGVELGGAEYGIKALTLCYFLMALAGSGWLITTTILTGSMEKVRTKLSGGDGVWLGLLSAGASIGLISFMGSQRIMMGAGPAAAVLTGFTIQFVIDKAIAPKVGWIKGYSLAFALVLGMLVGYLVEPT